MAHIVMADGMGSLDGPYSYGPRDGLAGWRVAGVSAVQPAYIVMAHIDIANVVMASLVMAHGMGSLDGVSPASTQYSRPSTWLRRICHN